MYKTINGWTKEKMIQHVKDNFKGKSTSIIDLSCLYRGPKGKKCAAGLFIPDKLYNESMETNTISILIDKFPKLERFMPLNQEAMGFLQGSHDSSEPNETLYCMLNFIEKNVEE